MLGSSSPMGCPGHMRSFHPWGFCRGGGPTLLGCPGPHSVPMPTSPALTMATLCPSCYGADDEGGEGCLAGPVLMHPGGGASVGQGTTPISSGEGGL